VTVKVCLQVVAMFAFAQSHSLPLPIGISHGTR